MGRAPCCDKVGLKRGPWTPEEDHVLVSFIMQHGHSNWRALPKQAGLLRCGKSCRLRWMNYLKPDVKRGNFTKEEEDTIIQLHEMMGNRWSAIAAKLPGRTDNEIKNVWHTHLKKRLNNNQNQVTKKNCKNNNKKLNTKNNNTNSNITTTTTSSETPNYSSQQSYSSDQEFSSTTEVSSVGEELVFDDHQIPIIDDSFWSSPELLSYDDIASMGFIFPDQVIQNDNSNNNISTFYLENNNNNNNNNNGHVNNEGESMDFWLDVFVNAGGPLELPQF